MSDPTYVIYVIRKRIKHREITGIKSRAFGHEVLEEFTAIDLAIKMHSKSILSVQYVLYR